MINVTKTILPQRQQLDKYIDRLFETGWITNNGELVQLLEKRLSDLLGVENLLLVSNGTLALQIMYRALNLKGQVITTPFSFVATTSSLLWEGLKPVFADIDAETFNLSPSCVSEKIGKETSAVLPVHVYGNACDTLVLEEICKRNNIKLIFDAAHAFSVSGKDGSILNSGDASILSFHATKIFHTIEGGAIVFKDKENYEKARLMINFGISGYDKIDSLGINCKMNEFQAAMGLALLDEFEGFQEQRKIIWESYFEGLYGNSKIIIQKRNDSFSNNYAYFPIVLESENVLIKLKEELNKNGINPRRYFYPSLNELPYLDSLSSCPISEEISRKVLCLPLYPGLEISIQNKIVEIVQSVVNN